MTQTSKLIGEEWNALTEAQKKVRNGKLTCLAVEREGEGVQVGVHSSADESVSSTPDLPITRKEEGANKEGAAPSGNEGGQEKAIASENLNKIPRNPE